MTDELDRDLRAAARENLERMGVAHRPSKTEVAILQASPDYPLKVGRWVDAKDYETLDRSLRESWESEKRLAAERDRLRAVLQTVRDRFWLECFDGKEPDAGEFGHQIDVLLDRTAVETSDSREALSLDLEKAQTELDVMTRKYDRLAAAAKNYVATGSGSSAIYEAMEEGFPEETTAPLDNIPTWLCNCVTHGAPTRHKDNCSTRVVALLDAQRGWDYARRNAIETPDGYKDAYYKIADLLGISAMPISPKEAFETVMLPRLRELLAEKTTPEQR